MNPPASKVHPATWYTMSNAPRQLTAVLVTLADGRSWAVLGEGCGELHLHQMSGLLDTYTEGNQVLPDFGFCFKHVPLGAGCERNNRRTNHK